MQHQDRQSEQGRALLALSVALEHPAVSTHPRVLRAAARASRAWRNAVQQCCACNAVVVLHPLATMPQLCSFATWMQNHASLVKSIIADVQPSVARTQLVHGLRSEHHAAAVQQLLQQTLQLAAVSLEPPAATPAAAAAIAPPSSATSAASQQQQQQQQQQGIGLKLVSFSSNYLATPGMLAVLPAHTLTHLKVDFMHSSRALSGPIVSAALALLSGLQQLQLGSWSYRTVPGSCLAGVAQLSRLTLLRLEGQWSELDESLQQLMAQPLPLCQLQLQCDWSRGAAEPVLQFAAQTQLTQLVLQRDLSEQTVLPLQLLHLEVYHCEGVCINQVMQLPQLQRLKFHPDPEDTELLLRLVHVPALQQLALVYSNAWDADAAAEAWTHLPQLCELSVEQDDMPDTPCLSRVLTGITAVTNLTKLEISGWDVGGDSDGEEEADAQEAGIEMCASLARLPFLQHLSIGYVPSLPPGDALALTALTGLTHLKLQHVGRAVDDMVASALACHLKQLHHLNLRGGELSSMACLAPIGQLTQLTELRLSISGLTERGLMLLTGLTNLQKLDMGKPKEGTEALLKRFWAALS